jgi:chromosome partitioning protein
VSVRIAICSEKGGVGKTTVAANLVALFGRGGLTLAVDVDPQGSLGEAFGVVAKGGDDSIAGLLTEDDPVEARAVIREEVAPGVDLIPAHRATLGRVNRELALEPGTHTSLRRALAPVAAEYDHVVLDTHGDTSDLTLNAICAADVVIGVTSARAWAAKGVAALAAFLARQHRRELTDARLLGVVCALYDKTGAEDRAVMDALRQTDLPLLEPYIPTSKRVASGALRQRPVVLSAPNSTGAAAYHQLADTILAAMAEGR